MKLFFKQFILSNSKIIEFIRFGFVGIAATVIHYGFYLLFITRFNPNVSYTAGYILSFMINFFLSNYFTFRTRPNIKKGIGFGISHGINYILHIVLLNLFLHLNLNSKIAPIPVFIIVIPVNFFFVRLVLKSKL